MGNEQEGGKGITSECVCVCARMGGGVNEEACATTHPLRTKRQTERQRQTKIQTDRQTPFHFTTHLQSRQCRVAGVVQLQHVGFEGLKRHNTQLAEQQAHGAAELTRSSVLCGQLAAALQPLEAGRDACRFV